MNHPLQPSLYNPGDSAIPINSEIEQPPPETRINNVTSANDSHRSINIDVHTSALADSATTVQQNFLSFLNEARSHLGVRPANLNAPAANSEAAAVRHHPALPVQPEDSNVNRWRVNLNNVLSFSAGPSTETIRSWIPRTSSFRYVPLNRSSSISSARELQSAPASAAGESTATNDVIINFSTISSPAIVDRENNSLVNREPQTPQILARLSSPRVNIVGGSSGETTTNGHPITPPISQPNLSNDGHRVPSTPPPAPQRNPLESDEDNLVYELAVKVLSHFVRYLPFIGIVLFKAIYDHWLGILDVLVLHALVYQMNKTLCEQVAKMSQKSLGLLFREYVLLTFALIYRFMISYNQPDYFGLLLNTAIDAKSLSQLLYAVAVNDLFLKLITIKIKILVTALPTDIIQHKSRGRLYALIEAISQLYRSLVPIKSWMLYLLISYTGFDIIVGMFFFSSLYMGAKAFEFVERGKFLKKAFCSFLRNVDYGRQPSKEELSEAGALCPICHDNYETPVVLECNHIFCEVCVGTWFKREQTCPMCRATVADDPTWQNGSTTLFYQLC